MNALNRAWFRLAFVAVAATAVLAIVVGVAAATGITGSATLTTGGLSMVTAPSAVSFPSTALNGSTQYLNDSTHGTFEVDDLTGAAAGWSITATATAFCTTTPGTCTGKSLPNNALSTNGSSWSNTATTPAGAACKSGVSADCVAGTSSVGLATVGQTATTIFNQPIGSGMGKIAVTGLNWWLTVPATAYAGSYTSNVVLNISSGP